MWINVAFCFFESLWRRWFGGGFIGGSKWENKWFNRRITQHLLNCVILFCFLFFHKSVEVYKCLYFIAVFEGLFWSKGHGPAFDMARGSTSESTIKRYNDVWFSSIVNFLVPQKYWYQYGYDWIWMAIRYIYPSVIICVLFGFRFFFMGFCVAPVYGFCASVYEKIDTTKFPSWLDRHNKMAEIIVGFLSGIFISFLF